VDVRRGYLWIKTENFGVILENMGYYDEVLEFQGVWASGKNLEECRNNLEDVIDELMIIGLKKGLSIPQIVNFNFETTEHSGF